MTIRPACHTVAFLTFACLAVGLLACSAPREPQEEAAPEGGKIAITTASREALRLYLDGRGLLESLRFNEARATMEKALAADPRFALAHLALATLAPTSQESLQQLKRADELAEQVSVGERLMILAQEANARSDPHTESDLYNQLVKAYPDDERAHQLAGAFYLGQQDYSAAVRHFTRASEIAPDFPPAKNGLGYALSALGRYPQAEEAFRAYIALVPNEPNPYDSHGELLLKMGRLGEAISSYQKALEKDPHFLYSRIGIGNAYLFMDRYDEARAEFARVAAEARNVSERRLASYWTVASHVFEGSYAPAMEEAHLLYGLGEESGDRAGMSSDLVLMGDILLAAGTPDEALKRYLLAVDVLKLSTAKDDTKEAARRNLILEEARVAMARGDLAAADAKSRDYAEQVAQSQVPAEQRNLHRLRGALALEQGNPEGALVELEEASQQDPRVLLLKARAYMRLGLQSKAKENCHRAANFNTISMAFAFTRSEARQLMAELEAAS